MRNKRAGYCYRCGGLVEVGQGYFQRKHGKWLVKHATHTLEEKKRCIKK